MAHPTAPSIDSIWATDAHGICTFAVERTAGLLPVLEQANIGDWIRSVHPDDGPRAAEAIAQAMRRRVPFRHEHRILCKDKRTRWVAMTGLPRFGANGEFEGFSGAIVDFTEQKADLERSVGTEAELRVIVDNSMDLIAHCGSGGRYTHVSSSYTRLLGWEAGDMIGQSVLAFLHPEDRAHAHAVLVRVLNGEDIPDTVEVRKRHRHGEYVALGTRVRKVSDPASGQVVGAVLVSRDITREREMLGRIERMAEQNSALLAHSPDIIMSLDLEGRILHANNALEKTTGYRPEEILGHAVTDHVSTEGRADASRHLETLAQGEGFLSSTVSWVCKDQRALLLDWSLCRPSGSNLIYVTARDITEQHQTRLALEQAHAHVRTILESIDDGFFSVNRNWEITYANTIAAAFVGLDRDAPIGKVLWDVALGLAESPAAPIYWRAMETRESTSFEMYYEPAGAWMSVRIYAHDEGLSVFFQDISERVNSDQLVRDSERRLRQMIEITPAGYVLTDADGIIREANPALCQLSGYASPQLLGQRIADVLFQIDQDAAPRTRPAGQQAHVFETVIRHRQGHLVHALVNQTSERDEQGAPLSFSAFITDITERKQTESRLEQLATRDVLTGLPNRAWLNQHLKTIMGATGDASSTTVLFIDLNRFKEVNDSLGHAAGDNLLQQVSQRLESCMRPGDVVARLGGDEFVVAANCAGRDAAGAIAQRLLAALTLPFSVHGLEIHVGASIGISLADQDSATPELLFQNADTAMYRAKAAGDSAYQFFEPEMSLEVKRKLQLEVALRRALDLGQFELYYQPRVDLRTMRVRGMEALLRWNHPEFGQVSPLQFIPIAEERGHIMAIGKWVLREACLQTRRFRDGHGLRLHVSVNVSARQLQCGDLVADVEEALRESGLPPGALELELTESALIEDTEQSATILRRLKQLGVRLSLDDFGTGYSSLSYLKRFPVDVMKLDRSFFHEQSFSVGNSNFVKAIIDMAHALGLTVVAEGIETEEVMDALRLVACDSGQGYLFARPLPPREFDRFLQCEAQ
jgi:diguanylate cyclase (GGDEF)-like protein/PAS domain S-box-containing protein